MERQLVEIFITHVEKEGPLLKLWAQTDRATPSFVERTINQLTEKFDLGIGIPDPSELAVGQLCCAKYNDGIYYRARITSLANLAKGEIGVQFADYGNLEVITLNNLRSLEGALTPLSTIADQASDFYLAGVVPVSGEWNPQSLKFVKDVICYVELKCVFVGQTSPNVKHFIKLIYQESDFASFLIERRIGVTILVDTQVTLLQGIMSKKSVPMQMWPSYNPDVPPPLAMAQPLSQLMVNSSMVKAADRNHMGMMGLQNSIPPPAPVTHMPMGALIPPGRGLQHYNAYPPPMAGLIQQSNSNRGIIVESTSLKREPALNFESICLEVGSQYDVRVAYVEDGPYCFVVSLKSMENVLGNMLTEINSVIPSPMTRPPMIGTTCLGRYTLDGSLCRAVVVTVVSDSCKVYYVDFGHSETLPYSELFELPQQYVTYPKVMAIQISHAGLSDLKVTQEMKELFKEYVVAKYFTLLVVPSESHHLKQYGILYEGGRGVLDIIQDQIEARKVQGYPVIPTPQIGSTKPILVSFVEGLDCFFVQLEDNTETLETVMSEILTHCEGTAPKLRVTDLHEGLLCCAKFIEDEQWYRAQISRITKEGIFVTYVDYGNTERVQLESLRRISPMLISKLHAQAIRCCLTKLHNWPKDEALIDKFSELTVDKTLIMQVVEHRPDGCPVVELHDLSLTNSAPVSIAVELQKMVKAGAEKQPSGGERNVYKAPTGLPHEYRDSKPIVESRSNDYKSLGASGDGKYQRSGSRNEPMSDWRAKNDDHADKNDRYGGREDRNSDRHGGSRGHDNRGRGDGDKGGQAWESKNNTWEGSTESKMSNTGFPQTKIPVGETKPAQLVFVESPEDFYIQLTPDTALNNIMADIAAKYEGGGGRVLRQVSVGAACIAQFSEDDSWYRAVVQSVDDEQAKVQFVDYGNVDDVPLRNIKEITPDFLNFPTQGIRCSLASALPKGSTWTDDEINDFTNVADGKSLEVKFVSERNGLYSVTVKDIKTGRVINEQFGAPSQFANSRPAPKQVSAPPKPVSAPRPMPVAAPSPPKPVIVQLFADPKARFTSATFEPESTIDVCVCWFISPDKFYVQDLSKAALVERTMRDIQHAYKGVNPNVKSIEATTPVIARYLGDNSLCRAEVVSNKNASAHIVQFVDFGNCDLITKKDMWQIEARFVDMPKQAVLCTLSDIKPLVDGEWPKNQAAVDKLFQDEKYSCTFHELLEDGKYRVTLTHASGASVAEEMVANGLAAPLIDEPEVTSSPCVEEPMDRAYAAGQTLHAAVTYVEGVAKFFVHLEGNKSEEVQALVDTHVLVPENISSLPADQVCAGKMCIATSDGSQWYRARIVDCSGTAGIYVVFVDYGDGDEVTSDKMIPIPDDLAAYPDQAVECGLTGCDVAAVKPETEDQFKADYEAANVIIHVDSVDDERLNVTVYSLDGKKSELVAEIGDGPATVSVVCPLPMLVQKPRVLVSHVDDASSVWLQKAGDIDALTDLLGRMYAHYEDEGKGVAIEPATDLICAAKSANDEQWYRARVTAIEEGGVNVSYIDYGNCEVVGVSVIKALDASFYLPHATAVRVSLPVVAEGEREIDLAALTADVEYVAAFSPGQSGSWWCELFNNKEALSDQLVESGWLVIENYPFAAAVDELTKSPRLTAGMWVSSFVSHVDTPRTFWIQRAENAEEIEKLQIDLQASIESLENLSAPSVGQLCTALFSEDSLWYRATVLEVNDTAVTVRFVDYGNTDVVDTTANSLKTLGLKLAKREVYALKCGLNVSPIDTVYSPGAIERFSVLVAESELPLNTLIIAEEEDLTVVDLFLGEKSLFKTLLDENLAVEHFDENSAFVSHVNSLSEFWIQYQKNTRDLETMADLMSGAELFNPLPSDHQEGILCAAQFVDDEQWYRARLTGTTDEGTTVHFVDYGNSAVATELRALPEMLTSEPPLAKRCTLLAGNSGDEWSEQAAGKFAEMVENATAFIVEAVGDEDPAEVELIVDGENLSELLRALPEKTSSLEESDETATEAVCEDKAVEVSLAEFKTPEVVVEEDNTVVLENKTAKEAVSEESKLANELTLPTSDVIESAKKAISEEGHLADELTLPESDVIESAEKAVSEEGKLADELTIPKSNFLESVEPLTDLADSGTLKEVAEIVEDEEKETNSPFVAAESNDAEHEAAAVEKELIHTQESPRDKDAEPDCDQESDVLATGDKEVGSLEMSNLAEDKTDKDSSVKEETVGDIDTIELKQQAVIMNGEEKETKEALKERIDEPMDVDVTCVDELGNTTQEESLESSVYEDLDSSAFSPPVARVEVLTGKDTEVPKKACESVESSEDLNSSGNSQFLDATSDVDVSNLPEMVAPSTPRTAREEKIVPGSISRGLSEEELQKYQFCPISDEPEHSAQTTPSESPHPDAVEDTSQSCPPTPAREVARRVESLEDEYVPSPVRLKHHERIVPGSISSGSSVDELRDPIENGIEIAEDTIADICDAVCDNAEKNLSSIDSAKELKDLSDVENGNNVPEEFEVAVNGKVPEVMCSTDAVLMKGAEALMKDSDEIAKE